MIDSRRAPGAPGTPSPADAAIELRGVRKGYTAHGDVVAAVRDVSLRIERGEFFSLLGPSGCGKTTTMRLIAGFEDVDDGSLLLDGRDVRNVEPNDRDVNMVFQNYALFPHLNVWDNIAFGLRRRRLDKSEIRERVGAMIEIVGLEGRERRRPLQLSGGQQQRVALARALVNRPAALLLDEPLGALDLQLRQAMQIELKRVQRDVGIAFVYVTHDQNEALAMSDRIAVMNQGCIEQLGTPKDIYERPASAFVANFIGASNVLSGTAAESGTERVGVSFGDSATLILGCHVEKGDRVEVSVRPESLRLLPTSNSSAGVLRGVIAESIYQGRAVSYTVDTATQGQLRVLVGGPDDGASRSLARGTEVLVALDVRDVHVIPPRGVGTTSGSSRR